MPYRILFWSSVSAKLHIMKLLEKTPLLTELSLLALFALLIFNWLISEEKALQPPTAIDQSSSRSKNPVSLSKLTAVPLFGKMTSQKTSYKPVDRPAPIAFQPLNMRVLGTVAAGDKSAAIILLSGKNEQKVVHIGDYIQPGIKLHYVDVEAVVVDRSGRLQRILLEHGKKLKGTILASKHIKPVASARNEAHPEVEAVINKSTENRVVSRQRNGVDTSSLMTQAKLEIHKTGDKVDGFLITHIVLGSVYQKSGLYNGDIIRKINGTKLLDINQADALYKAMASSKVIELEVIRAGQVKQLTYALE